VLTSSWKAHKKEIMDDVSSPSDSAGHIPDDWVLEACSPSVCKLKKSKVSLLSPLVVKKSNTRYVDNDWVGADMTHTELPSSQSIIMPLIEANRGCRRDIFVEANTVYGKDWTNQGFVPKLNPYDFAAQLHLKEVATLFHPRAALLHPRDVAALLHLIHSC
jgi:hypothetical protein